MKPYPTTGTITHRSRQVNYQEIPPNPVIFVEHQATPANRNREDLTIPILSFVIFLQFAMVAISVGFSAQSLSRVAQLENRIDLLTR